MEVQSSFNYEVPNYECYAALLQRVIPTLEMKYRYRYKFLKVPLGTARLHVIEGYERAALIRAKLQIVAHGVVPYTIGPELKFTCVPSSKKSCTLEVASEGSTFDGNVLNRLLDVVKGLYPKWALSLTPDYLLDDTVVYDKSTTQNGSYSKDMNVRLYRYVFSRCDSELRKCL